MPRFQDVPAPVGSALNVRVDFTSRGLITDEGEVPDLAAFKQALVSSIKEPIVFERGESLDSDAARAKLMRGQALYTRIIVHVAVAGGWPRRAGFREQMLRLAPDEVAAAYVVERAGDDVVFTGAPPIAREAQDELFRSLARDLAATEIFDEQGPALGAILRDRMDKL